MSQELWLTKADVIAITGWPKRTVEWKAQDEHLRCKKSDVPGKNGKRERVYAASSLPAACQPKLLEFCIRKSAGDRALVAASAWVSDGVEPSTSTDLVLQQSLFTKPVLMMQAPELADLDDEQRETARARFAVVSSLIEWRDGSRAPFITQDGREIRTFDDLVQYHAASAGIAARTVYKWLSRYEQGGTTPLAKFKALADHARSDRGLSRSLAKFPKAAEYALIKYLGLAPSAYLQAARELRLPDEAGLDYRMPKYHSERLPITAVYEGIEREWPNWYNHGSKPPSYTTIRNFIQSIPDCVKVMAREGHEAYENRCEPHGKRRYDDTPVNGLWVSDHRLFDVFTWNDYFPEFLQEKYTWMRVWLTTMEDMRTRRIVGWCFSVNPSSRSVAAAMRMGAMKYGMPQSIYMDNGEDYKLFAKVLLENFGITKVSAKPYRPRSKAIESWHSTLSKRFDPMFGPAYAGHDAKDRSEENTLALRQHKLWRDGKAAATPLPPVSYLMEQFAAWIEHEYNEWSHSGQDMQGLSPRVMYDRELPPESRTPLDVAQLEPLFWQRETRKVINSRVQIFSQDYEPADPESDFNLRMYANGERRDIRIACNPDDIAVALAYDIEGPDHRFIARLRAPQLLSHNPVSRDAIQAMERSNAKFRNGVKQYQRTLERRAVAAGITSELDALGMRAAVNAPRPMPAQTIVGSTNHTAQCLGSAVPSAADAGKHFLALEE